MKKVKTIFNVLIIIFVFILIFWFTQINYEDLSFHKNLSPYFGVLSMSMMIFSMQLIKNSIKKKTNKL